MRIAFIDSVHPVLGERLSAAGHEVVMHHTADDAELASAHTDVQGIVVRSRRVGSDLLASAKGLRFIARVGSGLENIDTAYCRQNDIRVRLATGTPSFLLSRIAPGAYVISIGADVAHGADPHALRAAISAYVDGLATLDVPDKAIDRLKRRFADQRKTQDAVPGDVYARLIQWLATPFDYVELDRIHDRLAALEKRHLAALLKQLAAPGRVVTGIVTPSEGAVQP